MAIKDERVELARFRIERDVSEVLGRYVAALGLQTARKITQDLLDRFPGIMDGELNTRQPWRRWTDAEVTEALAMRERGCSVADIGSCFDRTPKSVQDMLDRRREATR